MIATFSLTTKLAPFRVYLKIKKIIYTKYLTQPFKSKSEGLKHKRVFKTFLQSVYRL